MQTTTNKLALKDLLNTIALPKHQNNGTPNEARTITAFQTEGHGGKSFSFVYGNRPFSGRCDDRGVFLVNEVTNEFCLCKDVAGAERLAASWFNSIDDGKAAPAISKARLKKLHAAQALKLPPRIEEVTR